MKFEVIYKFFLVWGLALSLLFVVASGISMWLGFPFTQALDIHLFFAGFAVFGLLLHLYSRKKKWVKINTQFAEQLNLSLPILLNELSQAQIHITDSHRTLRENFPLNDEKIFAAITIALKVRFNPTLL